MAVNYNNGAFKATVVGYSVEERSSADDTLLFSGQLMYLHKLSDDMA